MSALGLDFGTTNTVLARAGANGHAQPIVFPVDGAELSTIRSILCFWFEKEIEVGSASGAGAIQHFLADPGDSRLLFEQENGQLRANPPSAAFIRLAGDNYDYRIVDDVASPPSPKNTQYRNTMKILYTPTRYYANFARCKALSIIKPTKEFRHV